MDSWPSQGDVDAMVELYDPGWCSRRCCWESTTATRRSAGSTRRRGDGRLRRRPKELIDTGDKVVAVIENGGAGASSQIALDEGFAFVFTFRASGWCESKPSVTRRRPSKPPGCGSRRCRRRTSRS